jgi:hypothetical protein
MRVHRRAVLRERMITAKVRVRARHRVRVRVRVRVRARVRVRVRARVRVRVRVIVEVRVRARASPNPSPNPNQRAAFHDKTAAALTTIEAPTEDGIQEQGLDRPKGGGGLGNLMTWNTLLKKVRVGARVRARAWLEVRPRVRVS